MNSESDEKTQKYELQPPDGGWGFVVTVALAVASCVTLVPFSCFGMIFGRFLGSLGDETSGTALTTGVFSTCLNFTGFVANILLLRFSFRMVAFMGAVVFIVGSMSTIFVTSLSQLIISVGIIEGVGLGLVYPAFYTALNCYFTKRLNLVNSIAQGAMVLASIFFPFLGKYALSNYGFRGTLCVFAALSLQIFPALLLLQPVAWHMKKVPIVAEFEDLLKQEDGSKLETSVDAAVNRSLSADNLNSKPTNLWTSFVRVLNLEMFKDMIYVNIATGLALCFTADIAFCSILPMLLLGAGLTMDQMAFSLALFYTCDLVGRFLMGFASLFYKLRNRYIFLAASVLTAVTRAAFVSTDDFFWGQVLVAMTGFLRCFIQNPLPVVIAEEYPDKFSTAFSLYMVVAGVVALICGPLIGLVKGSTGSDVMVVHFLNVPYMICAVSWSMELFCTRKRRS